MAALVISIVALALSVVSLCWQVWSWRRSGPVVHVKATQSLPLYDQNTRAGDWHITVTATNDGRAATTVTTWGLELPNGHSIHTFQPLVWSDRLPYRLEPHASGSWHTPTHEIQDVCQQNGVRYQDLRAWVSLQTGVKVYAKKPGIGLK